jgi:hypothetical protein
MNEIDAKAIWKSKTIIGIMVVWLGLKLKGLGLDIPDEVLQNVTDLLIEGGSILAVLGRVVAQQKLK